jgi:hypothetical protein
VDWVHNPLTGRCFGPRWTRGQNAARASPECGLTDDAKARSSPQLQKKIERILPVLTTGFGDWGNAGVELAAVDSGGSGSRSMAKRRGNREVDARCKVGALGHLLQ